ncbi:MAG: Uma2 family endonuclease [Blastocatellia bacterium]|nr:Uma2 family endonuclease [Blastocatellia bacterium]
MPETLIDLPYDLAAITRDLVTEDDVPVDNLFSAKQRRLLVEPLYSSWHPPAVEGSTEPRIFLADSDVGIFSSPRQPPIAPDMFLSLDVEPNPEYLGNEHRAYFVWEFDKVPEIAVEVVSNRKGKEMDAKMQRYAHLGIAYYVVFDPYRHLKSDVLQVHELTMGGRRYHRRQDFQLPEVALSLQLWRGEFEGTESEWLRWCDADGNLIPTGAERAHVEAQRADAEAAARQRAEAEVAQLRAELQRLQGSK